MPAFPQNLAYDVSMERCFADMRSNMSAAHSRIEQTFLEGGQAIVAVMASVTELLNKLEHITQSLDTHTTVEAVRGLEAVIADVTVLAAAADSKASSLAEMARFCALARPPVEDVGELFRYLRMFATSAKVTGAGIADFIEFTDEIGQQIRSGANEVKKFSAITADIERKLGQAHSVAVQTSAVFHTIVPETLSSLEGNIRELRLENDRLGDAARNIAGQFRTVSGKLAAALAALQVGDATRQRLEHVEKTLDLLEHSIVEHGGDAEAIDIIGHLAFLQVEDLRIEFHAQSSNLFAIARSFEDDCACIAEIRTQLTGTRHGSNRTVLSKIVTDLDGSLDLMRDISTRSAMIGVVVTEITNSAEVLLSSMELIRGIRDDIHYMALNTNLRCSRLGDAGRSMNVVSAELRILASKLEPSVNETVRVISAIDELIRGTALGQFGQSSSSECLLTDIRNAVALTATRQSLNLQELEREGAFVERQIGVAIETLAFERDLGQGLNLCAEAASAFREGKTGPPNSDILRELSEQIYALYTMAREREIHDAVFGRHDDSAGSRVRNLSLDEEDLFEGVLF